MILVLFYQEPDPLPIDPKPPLGEMKLCPPPEAHKIPVSIASTVVLGD
jgi:hypothetical protein